MNTQLFLKLSGAMVALIGLMYGAFPQSALSNWIGLSVEHNELHIFRAIMCLYIGIGGLLILAANKSQYILSGLILEITFMAALAAGRLLSFCMDGSPHWFALLAFSVETLTCIVCIILFKKHTIECDN